MSVSLVVGFTCTVMTGLAVAIGGCCLVVCTFITIIVGQPPKAQARPAGHHKMFASGVRVVAACLVVAISALLATCLSPGSPD
jgi:hypothetical protein